MYVCMYARIDNLTSAQSFIVAWVFNFTVARFKMGSLESLRTDQVFFLFPIRHIVRPGTFYACYETDFMTENCDSSMLSRPTHVFLQDIWNGTKTTVSNKSSFPKGRTHLIDLQANYSEVGDTEHLVWTFT